MLVEVINDLGGTQNANGFTEDSRWIRAGKIDHWNIVNDKTNPVTFYNNGGEFSGAIAFTMFRQGHVSQGTHVLQIGTSDPYFGANKLRIAYGIRPDNPRALRSFYDKMDSWAEFADNDFYTEETLSTGDTKVRYYLEGCQGNSCDVVKLSFTPERYDTTKEGPGHAVIHLEMCSSCNDKIAGVFLYEDKYCNWNSAVGYFSGDTGRSYKAGGEQFKNDEAQAIKLRGPLPRGFRVLLGDNPNHMSDDDHAVITLTQDLAPGEVLGCFQIAGNNGNQAKYHIQSHHYNGLAGKISRVETQQIQDGGHADLFHEPLWTKWFSEEQGWSSRVGPIQGMRCSGNYCDNKRFFQSSNSVCRGSHWYDTGHFSEESRSGQVCAAGYFVERMHCKSSKCDNVKLRCRGISTSCRLSTARWFWFWDENKDFYFDIANNEVMTGFQCDGRWCSRWIGVHVQRLVYVG